MQVETKNASLDTMAVTIQALHVSGKQMTLAVFRQLPITSLVLDSGDANARLKSWGLVRYKIADEGDVWVVVEAGGRLFRAPLLHPHPQRAAKIAQEFDDKIRGGRWSYINFHSYKTLADAEAGAGAARAELDWATRAAPVFEAAGDLLQLFIAV